MDLVDVAARAYRAEPLALSPLVGVGDLEGLEVLVVVALGEGVDPHDDPLAGVEGALELVGRVGDASLEPVLLDAVDAALEHGAAAELGHVGEELLGLALELVGQALDEPRAAQGVGDVGDVGLVGDDLLGAQRDARRLLRGQGQGLVQGVGVQALGPAEHARERLDGGARDVDLGLLGGERDAGGLSVEAQLPAALVAGLVVLTHPAGPDPSGGPVLRDLLEEVDVGVEEERQARGDRVDLQAGLPGELDVGEAVGEREGELLGRRGAGLADVVARDRDRVPPGHLGRREGHGVAHEAHRGPRREDELLLGLVLLQDVVLQGAPEALARDAGRLGVGDEEGEHHRGRGVDGHRGGDRREVDPLEQVVDVGERVDRDPAATDLAQGHRVVRVEPEQGRHVESRRQARPAGGDDLAEPSVGVERRAEAREHAHRPQPRAVHRGVDAPGVGVEARVLARGRAVDRLEGDPREGGEAGPAYGGPLVESSPLALFVHGVPRGEGPPSSRESSTSRLKTGARFSRNASIASDRSL